MTAVCFLLAFFFATINDYIQHKEVMQTMAERRMFSKAIISSDEFMDLPLESQALYFHLAMSSLLGIV